MKTPAFIAAIALGLSLAGTAQAQSATVKVDDLDLSSSAGKEELDNRIDGAALRICRNQLRTGTRLAVSPNGAEMKQCKAAVRAEVLSRLPAQG